MNVYQVETSDDGRKWAPYGEAVKTQLAAVVIMSKLEVRHARVVRWYGGVRIVKAVKKVDQN